MIQKFEEFHSLNESRFDKLKDVEFSHSGKKFTVKSISKNSKDEWEVKTTDNSYINLDKLLDSGALTLPEKGKSTGRKKLNRISKAEYTKILKSVLHGLKQDYEIDNSILHDQAENLVHDEDVKNYLEDVHNKESSNYLSKSKLTELIKNDLEELI